MSAPHQWYISLDGQQQGPVSAEQVAELALKRRILLTDHVWREGMADWSELQYVEELMGIVRRMGMHSHRPPGPATVSRPPSAASTGYRPSRPPVAQYGHSQRPAPRQSFRPQPAQSQNPPQRQGFQPASLQSHRSPPRQSQRPQPTGTAPDDKLNAYDSQNLAKLASSPALPQVAAAAFTPSTPAPAADSVRPPRIDPAAEAAVRPSTPPQRTSVRPSAAPAQTASAPAAAAPASRSASRTILLLSALSAFLMLGLAGTLAFFILRPGRPADGPAAPVQEAAQTPPAVAAPEPPPTPPVQTQPEDGPGKAEQEAEQQEVDEQSQTFVFELDDAQAGDRSQTPTAGPRPRRFRPKRVQTKAPASPAEKEETPAEEKAAGAADVDDLLAPDQPKGEDKAGSGTAGEEVDLFAEPLKKSGAAEKPAATAPKPDPNRSMDDLLNFAIRDDAKSKSAKPKPDPTATSKATAAAPAPAPAEKPVSSGLPETPSRDQILAGIRPVLPAAKACGKGAGGTAKSQITVSGATGQVLNVTVTGVPDDVGACIGGALRRARFTKFTRPTFNVSYPVRL